MKRRFMRGGRIQTDQLALEVDDAIIAQVRGTAPVDETLGTLRDELTGKVPLPARSRVVEPVGTATTDTTALQAAINAIAGTGGQVLITESITLDTDATITVPAGVYVAGLGRKTIVTGDCTSGNAVFKFEGNGNSDLSDVGGGLSHISVHHKKAGVNGIEVEDCRMVSFRDIGVHGGDSGVGRVGDKSILVTNTGVSSSASGSVFNNFQNIIVHYAVNGGLTIDGVSSGFSNRNAFNDIHAQNCGIGFHLLGGADTNRLEVSGQACDTGVLIDGAKSNKFYGLVLENCGTDIALHNDPINNIFEGSFKPHNCYNSSGSSTADNNIMITNGYWSNIPSIMVEKSLSFAYLDKGNSGNSEGSSFTQGEMVVGLTGNAVITLPNNNSLPERAYASSNHPSGQTFLYGEHHVFKMRTTSDGIVQPSFVNPQSGSITWSEGYQPYFGSSTIVEFHTYDRGDNWLAVMIYNSHTVKTQVDNTASRPSSPETGVQYFDTTLGQPIWYDGTNWVDSAGTTV